MGVGELDSIFDLIVLFIFWSLLIVPLVIGALLLLVTVVIALLSPVAALVSGVLAYRRGLNAFKYTTVGLLYSVMLGFPWLFLTLGMLNLSVPRIMVRTLYFVTYGVWLICILVIFVFAISYIGRESPPLVFGLLLVCNGVANSVLWGYSLKRLLHNNMNGEGFFEERAFPYQWSTLPFACLFFFMVLPLILWWLATQGSLPELVKELIMFLGYMFKDMLD